MIKKRGGQLTLFMIIGILILGFGFVAFYFGIALREPQQKISPEIAPVYSYVQGCIKLTAREALDRLGTSGGFIYVPESIGKNPNAYLAMGPGSILKMPYWWHDAISGVPSEEFMRQQLQDYIRKELGLCIDGFKAFHDQFQVYEKGGMDVAVTIGDESVQVEVNYPIEVAAGMNRTRAQLAKFSYTANVRLRKAYELAKAIMERENREFFIERKTIDMMSMDRLIPTTDVEATCSKKEWNFNDVKGRLRHVLSVNIPYIRIRNAEYAKNMYVPTPDGKNTYESSYYNMHYVWDVSSQIYKGMSVSFTFSDNWPFFMDARPRDGSIMKSNSMRGQDMLSWFCLHIWHFTYDVAYPVRASVYDKKGTEHEEYTFSFAFMTKIDHNQPDRQDSLSEIYEPEDPLTEEEYCKDRQGEITVYTTDASTGLDVEDANITLTCGGYTCSLGSTGYLSNGAAAGVTQKVPYCVNGVIKANKDGYLESKSFINTGRESVAIVRMTGIRSFTGFKVLKHPVDFVSDYEELKKTEAASIYIKALDTSFESSAIYPNTGGSQEIKILTDKVHKYEVNIFVMDGEDVSGGYKANWTVNPDSAIAASEIIFHSLDYGFVDEDSLVLQFSRMEQNSAKIPVPELK